MKYVVKNNTGYPVAYAERLETNDNSKEIVVFDKVMNNSFSIIIEKPSMEIPSEITTELLTQISDEYLIKVGLGSFDLTVKEDTSIELIQIAKDNLNEN